MGNTINKFLMIALMFIACIATAAFAQAAECSRSGNTMLITYSPNDLNVEEEFNLTYYDLFGGANQQATLNYPSALVNYGADTVTLINDGFGGGYYTWKMNSTMPGNHTISINISYEEGGCNITRIIEIQPTLEMPSIILSYNTTAGDIIANQAKAFSLLINNTGIGAAYNVNGWTSLGSVIDTFSYSIIDAGNSTAANFNVKTNICGLSTLESTVNYQDNFGYNYAPSHASQSINVVGSDLEITNVDVSDTTIRKGKILEFDVTIKNKNRPTTINAIGVAVKIYRDDDLIETINLGSLKIGESAAGEGSWKVSGKTGNAEIRFVVDSDNECNNWENEETVKIKINKEKEEDEKQWPWPDDEDKNESKYQPAAQSGTISDEPGENLGAIAAVVIAFELIALALVIVCMAKRKKRKKYKNITLIEKKKAK